MGGGAPESSVIAEVEQLFTKRFDRNERSANCYTEFVLMFNRLLRETRVWICSFYEPPRIERGVAEKLVQGAVVCIATLFHVVVLHAFALIHSRVARSLHLKLTYGIYRDGRPDKSWVAFARYIREWHTIDVDRNCAPARPYAVHNARVGCCSTAGLITLHARQQICKVGRSALVL